MTFGYPTLAALKQRRDEYSYPTVGLGGSLEDPSEVRFSTLLSMESHHLELLGSSEPSNVVLGYLSVLYWGHYSGSNGPNAQRAAAKVRLALASINKTPVTTYASVIGGCRGLLNDGKPGQALLQATKLPQMQAAFASKLCTFLNPSQCGVIDSVIAANHPELGFSLDKLGYVRTSRLNAKKYDEYCEGLVKMAAKLNALDLSFRWMDRDRTKHDWRAVDVERALYGQAG